MIIEIIILANNDIKKEKQEEKNKLASNIVSTKEKADRKEKKYFNYGIALLLLGYILQGFNQGNSSLSIFWSVIKIIGVLSLLIYFFKVIFKRKNKK